jgi:B-box zinc finger
VTGRVIDILNATKMAPALCAEHPKQELIGCCRDCSNVPVCALCPFSESHKKHDVCPFSEVMAENTTYLKDAVGVLSGHLGDLNTALAKVSAQKKSLDESLTTANVGLLEGFRKVQDYALGYMNGVTTENQTKLNGQHLTLEFAKIGVAGLKTAALETIDCTDYGHHSVKVNNIRREMEVLESATWPLEPCSTVLVFYDAMKLQDIMEALVYTDECESSPVPFSTLSSASTVFGLSSRLPVVPNYTAMPLRKYTAMSLRKSPPAIQPYYPAVFQQRTLAFPQVPSSQPAAQSYYPAVFQ